MAGPDPFHELPELVRAGREQARPLPPERVRQLGQQRRRRRHLAIATFAVLLVTGGGGVALGSGVLRTSQEPDPATVRTAVPSTPPAVPSPAATTPGPTAATSPATPPPASQSPPDPSPGRTPGSGPETVRTVTEANLLRVADLPVTGDSTFERYEQDARTVDRVSLCQQQSWQQLGATGTAMRSFREVHPAEPGTTPDPDDPLADLPTLYAVAVQFPDAAAAGAARQTYERWVAGCARHLRDQDYTSSTTEVRWSQVEVPRGRARFTDVVYAGPGHAGDDAAFFEGVGVTQVDDRLMVTVNLAYGQDYDVAYQQEGDPETQLPPHVQFGLCVAATARLAS